MFKTPHWITWQHKFDMVIRTLLDIFAPEKRKLVTRHPLKMWFTPMLKSLKKDLRSLEKLWLKFPSEHT